MAHAAGESPPLRFVTMYHPHGIAAESWAMRGTDTESNFDLTFTEPMSGAVCPLEPLDRHKSRLLIIEGIDLLSNTFGHDSAGTILTGSRINPSIQRAGNSSLDQFLAVEHGPREEHAHHQHRAGGGDRQRRHRRDAVLRRGRRTAAEDHRPGAGVRSPVRRPRAQRRSGDPRGGPAQSAPGQDPGRLPQRRRAPPEGAAGADRAAQAGPAHDGAGRSGEAARPDVDVRHGRGAGVSVRLAVPDASRGLEVPQAQTLLRRRALLRRHQRRAHRSHRARLRLRRHPVRDAVARRPVVRGKPARPAARQPRQRGAHLRQLARGLERQPDRKRHARHVGACWRSSTATPTARWRG